ncbi:sensor histidine kinase [Pararhizobium mangrovi]|uniref:histidine kinase n=1 Tax=Pararhizobium mangrovi TaxID=2590452 RepID=A0A506UHJ9_9HYPH|nr:ATP-binding protein [Pararhizobium mangrovi]TPW32778.1 HAMP domain-containing protein [Pararhizobium mangrovi]
MAEIGLGRNRIPRSAEDLRRIVKVRWKSLRSRRTRASVLAKVSALTRTTAVRLSALYLLLFAVCALALVFYVTAMSENLLRAQVKQAVDNEVQLLGQAYRNGGITTLVRVVERRSRQPGAALLTIAAPNGDILTGNVESLQPGVLDHQGWTQIPFRYQRYTDSDSDATHTAIARIIQLPNGMRLLVGRDLGEPERFRGLVRQALAVALAIMGLGALAIWFFVGRRALKRIGRMSAASRKIMAGDLAQRLPTGRSGDEFDRLSQSLNTMLGRIESLNEGLRQVSDNIAHDLKTPLTRMRNKAEAALASGGGDEDYRLALEETLVESDQLIRTFNALLMISRVEAGSSAAEMSPIDLSAIAADTCDLYEPLAEEEGMNLAMAIEPGVRVKGNRELVAQALVNLIDNAMKYAGDAENTTIRVSLADDEEAVVLSVEDGGRGIPSEKRDDVVRRFVRLDESRTMPGTGLGLSLVNAVMSLHGGRLALDDAMPDEAMKGLRVSMMFPKKVDA